MQIWPRILEITIGCWLLMSPFIFGSYPAHSELWLSDMICGALVIVISCTAISRRFRRLYLVNLAIAVWIVGYAYLQSPPPQHAPAWIQNDLIAGLILLMVAIIPSDTSRPPQKWQEFDIESE